MIKTETLFQDLKSGFFISLIALPLCLGIAIASSFPPIAGVITAIVGGLIVSLIGGCNLSIKGPAAGLIVIVLASVMDLGEGDVVLGYKRTLAVGVVAAVLQIIFALCKTARFGRIMPPSVIHGMLAAIGVIIVSKQIHVLAGVKPHGKKTLELIAEIPGSLMNLNPELALIGVITLFLMFWLPLNAKKLTKVIPPALIALFIVVPISLFWDLSYSHVYHWLGHEFAVGPEFLVNIPQNLLNSFVTPDFSILQSAIAYKYVLMLALVGSVESVLTAIAIDSLTKSKEKSNLDRDLLGVGIGNLICSLIGGLPMISEVVRSKANVDSGAKSRMANFFHGMFLLLAISLFAPVIKHIPLAALAAMLIMVGYRLAAPAQFKKTHEIGVDQLILFVTTLLVTLATDLLVGILVGILLKLVIHSIRGVKLSQMFKAPVEYGKNGSTTVLKILGPAVFSNYFSLQKQIMSALSNNEKIEIDFSKASLIDHTTLSCIHDLKDQVGHQRIFVTGLNNHSRSSNHQLSTHRFA